MTIQKSLNWAIKQLNNKKIDSLSLDSEVLLSFVIRKPREYLYSYSEKKLTQYQLTKFKKLISRRTKREPVAYLTNKKEFYGLNFYVDKNVLIPRPETEILVEEIIKIAPKKLRNYKLQTIVDVGTGSGCLAIALAKHLSKIKIYATDVSQKSLRIAKKNAKLNGVEKKITFLQGDLLKPLFNGLPCGERQRALRGQLLIVANLPYLTTSQWRRTLPEIKLYEPRQALAGGSRGLKYFCQLLQQLQLLITDYSLPITLFLETDPHQIKLLKKLIKKYFSRTDIKIKKDLAGLDRLVTVRLNVCP